MTGLRAIELVVRREVRERVRSRTFQVSTVIALLVVIGAIVIPTLASSPLRSVVRVGLVERDEGDVAMTLDQLGDVTVGSVVYSSVADRAAAERLLRDDEIHLAVVGREAILLKTPIDENDMSAKVRVARVLSVAHGFTAPPLPIDSVEPAPPRARRSPAVAFSGAIVLYVFLAAYGSMILTGVAEEKGSRVIEILLAAVRPRDLFAGKVIGIGIVALLQAAIVAAVALAALQATGRSPLSSAEGGQVLAILGWLLLGYAFYSSVYAAAGAMVSRQEEASGIAFPVSMPILISYIAAASAMAGGEDSRLLRALSFLPPTAPIAMPMRSAMGFASSAQVAVAVAVTALGALVVIRLAAAIYARSILRTGSRVRLREIVRREAA